MAIDYGKFLSRLAPSASGLSDDERNAVARRGLLSLGLGILGSRSGGNFGMSLADGLKSGLLAVDDGVQGAENTRYKNEILARTRQGMERNTAIEQAQQGVLNPDGTLNQEKWGQWAQYDPTGAIDFREKAQPKPSNNWAISQVGDGGGGLLDVWVNKDTREIRDLQGNSISGGLLAPESAQPQMPSRGLLSPGSLGQFGAGNIDLTKRPRVKNSDGSVSTVLSFSTNIDGKEVLLPLVSDDGRVVSEDEAIRNYEQTGRHLGKFNTPAEADAYAELLHNEQESMYARPNGGLLGSDLLPGLEKAVMQVESGGNPAAVSPKGAMGTMQTMPGTLVDPGYGVTPARDRSPGEMERVGKDYLQAMLKQYGDPRLALAAYNWGPGNVDRAMQTHGGNVDAVLANAPAETRAYVPKVLARAGGEPRARAGQGYSQIGRRPAKAAQQDSYRTMTPAEVAQIGLPVGTVAQVGPAGQIQVVNRPAEKAAGSAQPKTTEDQNKSAGYALRMENALKDIAASTATDKGAARPGVVASVLGSIPFTGDALANAYNSPQRQNVEAAQLDALDAALTLNTGAAYTKEQLKGLSKAYFPQIGDDESTVASKNQRLQSLIQTARLRARGAYPDNEQQGGVGAPAPGTIKGGYRFKGGNPADKNNWERI